MTRGKIPHNQRTWNKKKVPMLRSLHPKKVPILKSLLLKKEPVPISLHPKHLQMVHLRAKTRHHRPSNSQSNPVMLTLQQSRLNKKLLIIPSTKMRKTHRTAVYWARLTAEKTVAGVGSCNKHSIDHCNHLHPLPFSRLKRQSLLSATQVWKPHQLSL